MTQRKEFEKHIDEWMKKWTGLIDGLELKLADDKNDLDEDKKAEIRDKINDLKTVRQTLSKKHIELRKADDRNWPEVKEHVENMMGHIDEEFRKSLAYFH